VHAGELALRTGDVAGAEREARAALELTGDLGPVASGARVVLAGALTERGEFGEAATLLRAPGLDSAAARHAQARLWLATGEYERGYAEAVEAGARCARDGHLNPARLPWRTTTALALAHLGRRREAAALADEDVARTTRFRAPVALLTALHARAVAEADEEERVALCRRALGLAGGVNAVLHTVRLRLELGSTLSRLGSRVEARDALRPALAAADEAGAMPLAERARRELVATGLRPRRAAIEGAAALTPRQRQICTLAAAGKRNREIGHALFLSVKTVETHLASAYRKLGISSRDDLELALAGA
jgi:DNA-binding CsgD family transcriptional regulator